MARLFNEIPRLIRNLKVIEQYNNFRQLGATDDILFLREKINNLYNLTGDTEKLIEEFNYCAKMINMFYDEIDPEFKIQILKEERNDI